MAAANGRKSFFLFGGGCGGGGGDRFNHPRNTIITSLEETDSEFQESDIWNSDTLSDQAPSSRRSLINTINSSSSRGMKKPSSRRPISGVGGGIHGNSSAVATSLPVNIPDWSRILGEEYCREHKRESDQDDVEGDEEEPGDHNQEDEYGRLPPHEYLARVRGSSFSVHEGIGRTLKGRDLSRVRNAVWKQTGFED